MENRQLSRTDNSAGQQSADFINEQMDCYGDMVYRIGILYLHSREDAEDVFQEVFLKLYLTDTVFETAEHRRAWLATAAVNYCKNILRSVWRRRTVELDELCAVAEDDYGAAESDLVRQLMELPLRYRRVLYLHYYEGYTGEEIGAMLKISPATVRTQMRRGREMLKTQILKGDES
ncbi:MAG: sigma-70 family RNA polymerase sigma factor [Oscillospiraceae bacterium]|nr:sigma-70 family RNA polymerase sigma factor [Oscillospiraceae bacterium]